jgi:hypothetical protein
MAGTDTPGRLTREQMIAALGAALHQIDGDYCAEETWGHVKAVYDSLAAEGETPPDDHARTVRSIAAMLGWGNVPPRETLERDIAAPKARAQPSGETPPPAPDMLRQMRDLCVRMIGLDACVEHPCPLCTDAQAMIDHIDTLPAPVAGEGEAARPSEMPDKTPCADCGHWRCGHDAGACVGWGLPSSSVPCSCREFVEPVR